MQIQKQIFVELSYTTIVNKTFQSIELIFPFKTICLDFLPDDIETIYISKNHYYNLNKINILITQVYPNLKKIICDPYFILNLSELESYTNKHNIIFDYFRIICI
jgi:hypothetical protein